MSELKKLLLSYVENKFAFMKQKGYKLYYLDNSKFDGFTPIIFDRKNKLNCILNLKNQEQIEQMTNSQQILRLSRIEVTDSNFDVLIYKKNNCLKCLVVLIINECDFIDVDKKFENIFYQNLVNLNFIDEVQTALQKYIFDYLKENQKNEVEFPHWMISEDILKKKTIPNSNYIIENTLLGYNSCYQGKFRFMNYLDDKFSPRILDHFLKQLEGNGFNSCAEIYPAKIDKDYLKEILSESSKNANSYKSIFFSVLSIEKPEGNVLLRNQILER